MTSHHDQDRLPDPAELNRFRARSGDPAATIRFALHLQVRDPTNIWAPMTLAEHASSPEERLAMLQGAIKAGLRRWMPERQVRTVGWWDELETRPFLMAIYAFGHQSAVMGFRDDAAKCVKQLLKMDKKDRVGAERLAATMGLIPAAPAEAAREFRM